MHRLVRLYLEYMKTALLAMAWLALFATVYTFIRTSDAAAMIVAGVVSLAPLVVVLLLKRSSAR